MAKSLEQRVKDHLCHVYGMGPGDVLELFEIGRGTVADALVRIEGALSREDMQEVVDASHMLKGTLFNMGLHDLGEMARSVELAGKARRLDEARSVFPGLRRALAQF